jgi:hypothetical protein
VKIAVEQGKVAAEKTKGLGRKSRIDMLMKVLGNVVLNKSQNDSLQMDLYTLVMDGDR